MALFQYKYPNRVSFDCKTITVPLVPGRHGKYIFTQKSVYPQGVLNGMDESFLDCKHEHMMKSGAPPDKVRVLHRLLHMEFHAFTSRIDLLFGS